MDGHWLLRRGPWEQDLTCQHSIVLGMLIHLVHIAKAVLMKFDFRFHSTNLIYLYMHGLPAAYMFFFPCFAGEIAPVQHPVETYWVQKLRTSLMDLHPKLQHMYKCVWNRPLVPNGYAQLMRMLLLQLHAWSHIKSYSRCRLFSFHCITLLLLQIFLQCPELD